jgi:hypothetical protein
LPATSVEPRGGFEILKFSKKKKFGPWGGQTTPKSHGGSFGHPQLVLGGGSTTPRSKSKKFKICLPLGVAEPSPKAMGWLKPPLGTTGVAAMADPIIHSTKDINKIIKYNDKIYIFLFSSYYIFIII